MQSTRTLKRPAVKEKRIKLEPRIYVLLVFELDDKCKQIWSSVYENSAQTADRCCHGRRGQRNKAH